MKFKVALFFARYWYPPSAYNLIRVLIPNRTERTKSEAYKLNMKKLKFMAENGM